MKKQHLRDPLFEILERHIFRAANELEKSGQMVQDVINEYLQFLSSQGVHIPGPVKGIFIEDLREEIKELTLKRTVGVFVDCPPPVLKNHRLKPQ